MVVSRLKPACTADYDIPEHTMLCCTYITVCVYVTAKEIKGDTPTAVLSLTSFLELALFLTYPR